MTLPAIVLCGGLGTRLRGAFPDVPKVLAPVGGVPFLDHLLRLLARHGLRDIVLAAGVGSEQVRRVAGDGSEWGLSVRTVVEPNPLGTAGAARFALEEAGIDTPFFVVNGDSYFGGDLGHLVARHVEDGSAVATLGLARVADASRYGTVEFDEESGVVTGFREKDHARSGAAWINAGTYVLSAEALTAVRPGQPGSIERDVFPGLVGRGLRAVGFPDATFIDIGTPEDHARAESMLGS
jgi:NDP-sugar pyrophosphorylase family protein